MFFGGKVIFIKTKTFMALINVFQNVSNSKHYCRRHQRQHGAPPPVPPDPPVTPADLVTYLFSYFQTVVSLHLLQEATLAAGVEHSFLDAAAVSRHGVDEH